jgi:hypothetical protein
MTEKVEEKKDKKRKCLPFIIVIILLLGGLGVLTWLYLQEKEELEMVSADREYIKASLNNELDSLMSEHQSVKQEYGELTEQMSEKDSLIQANAEEIKKLLAINYDYRKVKRQLRILRNIQQGYIDQLDSLYTVNRVLQEELDVAKKNITQEKSKNTQLSEINEELNKKVDVGSSLRIYNLSAEAYALRGRSDREVQTYKARRVDRLTVCFTLGENPLVEPGNKNIYIRIARPDNLILARGQGDEYSFEANGVKLQYSIKEVVDYQNKAQKICVNWDKRTDDNAMEGMYKVIVYIDDVEVGTTSITLD